MYNLIIDLPKKRFTYILSKIKIWWSLNDEQFISLIKEAKEFTYSSKTEDELKEISKRFIENENNIKSLFYKPNLIKNIIENAIITILTITNSNIKDLENNFILLNVEDCSIFPLSNIPFYYNYKKWLK